MTAVGGSHALASDRPPRRASSSTPRGARSARARSSPCRRPRPRRSSRYTTRSTSSSPGETLATTTAFRYAGDAIAEETVNGTVTRSYLTDDAGTIFRVCDLTCTAPVTSYLPVWNGHGDATALYRINTDGTLTLANSYTYGTWGTPTVTTHNSIGDLGFRFRYVGARDVQWDDQLGMGLPQ